MNIPRKKWFEYAVKSSKLPQLVNQYELDSIIQGASSFCSYDEFEILLSSCAICQTGNEIEIEESKLIEIVWECREIISNRPKHEISSLNSFARIRGLRPHWFSIPIYEELLSPFNSQSIDILKASVKSIV